MFDTGLGFSRWLLSWLDPEWQNVFAIPLLIVVLLLAMTAIVRLLPVADRVIGPVGSGLATALGMLFLLPEYLCTWVLRRSNHIPPGFFHTYGEGIVNLVGIGHRVSRAGLTGFTRGNGVRKLLILTAVAVVVAAGNAQSCPTQTPRCAPTLTAWWTQTKAAFAEDPPPSKPKPKPRTTKKPVPKKTQ